jgi:hypothetical protein
MDPCWPDWLIRNEGLQQNMFQVHGHLSLQNRPPRPDQRRNRVETFWFSHLSVAEIVSDASGNQYVGEHRQNMFNQMAED